MYEEGRVLTDCTSDWDGCNTIVVRSKNNISFKNYSIFKINIHFYFKFIIYIISNFCSSVQVYFILSNFGNPIRDQLTFYYY